MDSKRKRPARQSADGLDLLGHILKSPTMVAVAVDPTKGVFHACVRNGQAQKKWSQPLNPTLMAVFAMIKSLVASQ